MYRAGCLSKDLFTILTNYQIGMFRKKESVGGSLNFLLRLIRGEENEVELSLMTIIVIGGCSISQTLALRVYIKYEDG